MQLYGETIAADYEREAAAIRALIDYADQGHEVCLAGSGHSMEPLMRDGRDFVLLRSFREDEVIRKGDIILYFARGHYILHRVYSIVPEGYCMLGDGNIEVEPPIGREKLCLKAFAVKRKGRIIRLNRPLVKLYGRVWMALRSPRPWFRHMWRKIYRFFRK